MTSHGGKSSTPSPRDQEESQTRVVTYNSNHMYAWILAVTFVIALIVGGYYSAKFSRIVKHHSITKHHHRELCKKINDITVCQWFFATIPVLNLGLAGGLGHNVNQLAKHMKAK